MSMLDRNSFRAWCRDPQAHPVPQRLPADHRPETDSECDETSRDDPAIRGEIERRANAMPRIATNSSVTRAAPARDALAITVA